jgi:hypothetical protein
MPPVSSWLAVVLGGTILLSGTGYFLWQGYRHSQTVVTVAFVGNSFQFVNDLPRVMEYLSDSRLLQDSCLHGSLNFKSLTRKGNGMYNRWKNSTTALLEDGTVDYGACTIPQLLLGYDFRLESYEQFYYDDGKNPCFQDADYLAYAVMTRAQPLISEEERRRSRKLEQQQNQDNYDDDDGVDNDDDDAYGDLRDFTTISSKAPLRSWDFVVLNDQSLRPTNYNNKIKQSGYFLKNTYVPMLRQVRATPVLYLTWAYEREDMDMSPFGDIPVFTGKLLEGYQYYASVLEESLPEQQQPIIAPVGLAFLLIWEENPSFWKTKMFAIDNYHPSPHGTYLAACVLHCTLYGHLPASNTRFTDPVFERSRRMELAGDPLPLPTEEEAIYLRHVASQVALHGYMPKSLVMPGNDDDSVER